jgi:spermidine synthase
LIPWVDVDAGEAPDGTALKLRRRGSEWLILADGRDLMSSQDEPSSRALADIGCAHLDASGPATILVGGLGMGFTMRAALDRVGPGSVVEVAELVPAVVKWNEGELGELAGRPLGDPRSVLRVADVRAVIASTRARYDAILLDVDNGPDALGPDSNERIYDRRGIADAVRALKPSGVLAVWSFSDDPPFTRRLIAAGLEARTHRVANSRRGRGRHAIIFVGRSKGGGER